MKHFHTTSSKPDRIGMSEAQKRRILKMFEILWLLLYNSKTKRLALEKETTFHHNVSMILLRNAVAKDPAILRMNPKRDPLKPCVYVGKTGILIDHGF